MINTDEDALQCDLAEVYHIFDYKSLPCSKVAIFSSGLRDNSRIKMILHNDKYTLHERLGALCADRLTDLVWSKTKDGQKNRNRPPSIYAQMIEHDNNSAVVTFEGVDAFNEARAKIMSKGGTNG